MAIVLAAGGSRRFGRGDKLLARLGRRTVLEHALACAAGARPGRLLVVVPSAGGRIARALAGLGLGRVVARDHARGMGASLRAGLEAVRPIEREVMIFLADMPFATAPGRLRLRSGRDAVRPAFDGKPGHPLLVRTRAARAAGLQADDVGLAAKLDRARIAIVSGSIGNLFDIDTRRKLREARRSSMMDAARRRGNGWRSIRHR